MIESAPDDDADMLTKGVVMAEVSIVVLASPPMIVVPPTITVLEVPSPNIPPDMVETWVNGTAEPAVHVVSEPRLIELSFGSP